MKKPFIDENRITGVQPNLNGVIAISLIERWGLVAAEPDGESSNGMQKGKLISEKDLVERAFRIAQLTVDNLYDKKWLELKKPKK